MLLFFLGNINNETLALADMDFPTTDKPNVVYMDLSAVPDNKILIHFASLIILNPMTIKQVMKKTVLKVMKILMTRMNSRTVNSQIVNSQLNWMETPNQLNQMKANTNQSSMETSNKQITIMLPKEHKKVSQIKLYGKEL